jgi:hypothetical protein
MVQLVKNEVVMNPGMGYRGAAGGNINNRSAGNFRGDKIPEGFNAGQLQQFTPDQMQLFQQLFSHAGPESYLSKLAGGDQSQFDQMEAPAWRQFQEAQGQLGSRFSQMSPGAMSAQRGSGFQNSAGQLGSDFAMQLQSNRQSLQRQAIQDLMGLSSTLLGQRPYDRFLQEKPQSQSTALGGWGGALGAGIGGLGGFFAGGPAGAFAGANIGSKAFSGL